MKALIIAAGSGTRFGKMTENEPKPLMKLGDGYLVQWVMKSLVSGGVSEIFIVVGYLGNQIVNKIGDECCGVPVRFIDNRQWKKGNLMSLYSAKDVIHEREFLLSMSDHLFDPAIVRDLLSTESDSTVLLAVDRKYQQSDDDMKVMAKDGFIADIGKSIQGNYVDIGLFKMKSSIFEYAEKSVEMGKYQLFEAVKAAAENGDSKIMDINRRFWIDVDTPEELDSYYVQNYPKFLKNKKWD